MDECKECGMPTMEGEYHPYAACLMFKTCRDSAVVRDNLDAVVNHGYQARIEEVSDLILCDKTHYVQS